MTPLETSSAHLLSAGYVPLGVVRSPDVAVSYFVRPAGCMLASIADQPNGFHRVRAMASHPAEVVALAITVWQHAGMDRTHAVTDAQHLAVQLSRFQHGGTILQELPEIAQIRPHTHP
jgi:hypothetical protein